MQTKILFSIFLFLLIASPIFALNSNDIEKISKETYLLNPLVESESIIQSTLFSVGENKFWVAETNTKDYIFLDYSDAKNEIEKDTVEKLIETKLFFSGAQQISIGKFAPYFANLSVPLTNYGYNLELLKKDLILNYPDINQNVITGITNVQTRAKDIILGSNEVTKDVLNIDNNIGGNSYEAKEDIKIIATTLEKEIKDLSEKIQLLNSSVMQLKLNILDANLSLETKYSITNNILVVPSELSLFPEKYSQVLTQINGINEIVEIAENETNVSGFSELWAQRLQRAKFLKTFLLKDNTIKKQTGLETPKTLFDYVLSNKDKWNNFTDTNTFVNKYKTMYDYLDKKEFQKAEKEISSLVSLSFAIVKDGLKKNEPAFVSVDEETEDNPTNSIIKYIIIGIVAIVLIIIGIKVVKKIKEEHPIEKEKDINIDLN